MNSDVNDLLIFENLENLIIFCSCSKHRRVEVERMKGLIGFSTIDPMDRNKIRFSLWLEDCYKIREKTSVNQGDHSSLKTLNNLRKKKSP